MAEAPIRHPAPACAVLASESITISPLQRIVPSPPDQVEPMAVPEHADTTAAMPAAPPTIHVGGTPLFAITETECVEYILGSLRAGRGGFGITVNLEIFRLCHADRTCRAHLDAGDLWVADGMTVLWASRIQGTPLPERVCGSNLIWSLTAGAARDQRSVFFLGGNPGTAERASTLLSGRYPGLRVAGTYCPAFGFENDAAEIASIRARIAAARPDIIYVALGFPKGERLIQRIRSAAPDAWWLGVGISFSFVCGDVKRAPVWMQHTGLEWLHRLIQEPRRLGKRYLINGPCAAFPLLARCALQRLRGLGHSTEAMMAARSVQRP